tara:strand:- start:9747 stop:10619 length:873 start_codon:yes stop_codon:yes gene_type:complete
MAIKVTGLFDGDILAYRAGFAAEKMVYFDLRNLPNHGGVTWGARKEVPDDFPSEFLGKERKLEPLANALYNVKSLIQNSLDALRLEYDAVDVEYETFLSGRGNFRKLVDENYKANRKDVPKPTYLPQITEYLIERHHGFLTTGCEADDFFGHASLTARAKQRVPVIISIDKDLKQLEGFHYNPVKGIFSEMSRAAGELFFWRQMLQGDRVDNIPGIPGIGPAKAERFLPDGTSNEQAQKVVVEHYENHFAEQWKERYRKNSQLLWIWRTITDECPFKLQEEPEGSARSLP